MRLACMYQYFFIYFLIFFVFSVESNGAIVRIRYNGTVKTENEKLVQFHYLPMSRFCNTPLLLSVLYSG